MLRKLDELFGYDVVAARRPDEQLGKVDDAYFDDEVWTLRYFVVDTGGWFSAHPVLVAPEAFVEPDWTSRTILVEMTREQIERSPKMDADRPVSRHQEFAMRKYYGWSPYWGVGMTPLGAMYPTTGQVQLSPEEAEEQRRSHDVESIERERDEDRGDPNLRSAREVAGYNIRASDGEIGHVADFIVETDGWQIRYLVVDTRNWLPGKKVLVAPAWVERVDYPTNLVHIDLPRDRIKDAPEFDASAPVNRAYEMRLYDYYGRPAYWSDERARKIV